MARVRLAALHAASLLTACSLVGAAEITVDARNDSDEVILTAHADWERGYPVGTPGSWLIAHLSGDELVTLRRRLN